MNKCYSHSMQTEWDHCIDLMIINVNLEEIFYSGHTLFQMFLYLIFPVSHSVSSFGMCSGTLLMCSFKKVKKKKAVLGAQEATLVFCVFCV